MADIIIEVSGGTKQVVEVDPPAEYTAVVQGGPGPAGPPGPGGTAFNYTQSASATVWTVPHNLGYRPTVTVYSPGGQVILAQIDTISLNTLQVTVNPASTGYVRCV